MLPKELSRHAPGELFAPDELRGVCRASGEGLGRVDAGEARSAAAMVALPV